MNCDQAQREIVVPSDPRDWRDSLRQARALRHIADCPNCAAFAARLHQLDAQIETWKAGTSADVPADFQVHVAQAVGDVLRDRAASALLAAPDTQNTRKKIMTPITTGTAAFAIAGCALTFFALNQNTSETKVPFTTMLPVHAQPAKPSPAANTPIRNAHVKTWTLDAKNDLSLEEEMWYENSRWRKEGTYGSRLIIGGAGYPRYDDNTQKKVYGTYYRYDSAKHQVVHMTETGEQRTDFTFDSILPQGAQEKLAFVGRETINGQKTMEYQLDSSPTTRWRFWADRDTGLPVRYERATQERSGTSWVTVYSEEYEFNKPLNESLFDSNTLKDEGWRL